MFYKYVNGVPNTFFSNSFLLTNGTPNGDKLNDSILFWQNSLERFFILMNEASFQYVNKLNQQTGYRFSSLHSMLLVAFIETNREICKPLCVTAFRNNSQSLTIFVLICFPLRFVLFKPQYYFFKHPMSESVW